MHGIWKFQLHLQVAWKRLQVYVCRLKWHVLEMDFGNYTIVYDQIRRYVTRGYRCHSPPVAPFVIA